MTSIENFFASWLHSIFRAYTGIHKSRLKSAFQLWVLGPKNNINDSGYRTSFLKRDMAINDPKSCKVRYDKAFCYEQT